MNRIVLVILLALPVSLSLYAADAGSDAVPQEQAATRANDQPKDPQGATDSADGNDTAAGDTTAETDDDGLTEPPSDEDFVPTVRITEDLPVAFPVDI